MIVVSARPSAVVSVIRVSTASIITSISSTVVIRRSVVVCQVFGESISGCLLMGKKKLTSRSSRSHVCTWSRVVWLLRGGKVHTDASALKLDAVQAVNALLRILDTRHSDESKATRSFGLADDKRSDEKRVHGQRDSPFDRKQCSHSPPYRIG